MTARFRPLPAAALACAVAIAAALRAWHIADWPLWLDESWSRWQAEQGWHGLIDSTMRFDVHLPFYYSLLKLWLLVAPHSAAGMRLLSVLAGVAIVPLAWAAARQIPSLRTHPAMPLLAAALVALSPPLLAAARQARPYALFALAFAAALLIALRLARREERGGGLGLWLGYGIAIELTLWLHNLGILFAGALSLGLLAAFAATGRLRQRLVPFLLVHVVVGAAYLPGFLAILAQRRTWTSTWLRFTPADIAPGLTGGLATAGLGGLLLFALAIVGAAALLRDRDGRPAACILLLGAFVPAAITIAASLVSAPVFLPRTLVPSVLPLLLLAVAGIAAVQREALRAGIAAAALLFVGLPSLALAAAEPEEKWDALGAWLGAHVAPGEEVWLMPNELVLPLRYANPGLRLPLRGMPADFPAPDHRGPRYSGTIAVPGMTAADAARLTAEARRRGIKGVWVVSRFPALFDPGADLPRALGPPDRGAEFVPLAVRHYALR
jgi:uncharacterized membrane protein